MIQATQLIINVSCYQLQWFLISPKPWLLWYNSESPRGSATWYTTHVSSTVLTTLLWPLKYHNIDCFLGSLCYIRTGFCIRDIQFTHVQCSEVQLWKRCFLKFFFTLNEANTRVALPNAWRCAHNNNGLQSTVDKSIELRWVVCGVAEL
jgi:hypothetical protein